MTDKTKSGVWKAKLTEQKHRFDVLGFLSEQCMNGTDEDMERVRSYNIKYKSFFFKCVFFNPVFCYLSWFPNASITPLPPISSMRRNALFPLHTTEAATTSSSDNTGSAETNTSSALITGNTSNTLVPGGTNECRRIQMDNFFVHCIHSRL